MRPFCLILAAPVLLAARAPAATPEAWAACTEGGAQGAVAACTTLLAALGPRDPARALALFDRANAWRSQSRLEAASGAASSAQAAASLGRALADYSAAIHLSPAFAEAYANRGIVWHEMGRFDRAIADYTAAIRQRPFMAEAYNNRALAHLKTNNPALAQPDFDRTIQLSKNYGNALILRALPSAAPQEAAR